MPIRPLVPSQLAVPNGLVGYWPLGADTTDFHQGLTFDISGNGHTGTLSNLTATSLRQGQIGTALKFNGSSSYVSCGNILNQSATSSFSILLWINCGSQSAQNYPAVVAKNNNANSPITGYNIFINSSSGVISMAIGDGSTNITVSSSAVITDSNWHCIGAICNRSTQLLTLYSDNAPPVTSATISGVGSLSNSANLYFGVRPDSVGPENWYSGTEENIAFYNRATSPWEYQAFYRAGLAGRRDAGKLPIWSALPALSQVSLAAGRAEETVRSRRIFAMGFADPTPLAPPTAAPQGWGAEVVLAPRRQSRPATAEAALPIFIPASSPWGWETAVLAPARLAHVIIDSSALVLVPTVAPPWGWESPPAAPTSKRRAASYEVAFVSTPPPAAPVPWGWDESIAPPQVRRAMPVTEWSYVIYPTTAPIIGPPERWATGLPRSLIAIGAPRSIIAVGSTRTLTATGND